MNILHRQLGYPSSKVMGIIISGCKHLKLSIKTSFLDFCDACQYGKIHKLHFSATEIKLSSPLELVFTDLWGPAPMTSLNDYKYYITFVDDFS